jgi:thiol-disulfide isomerase/thioredoxin
MIELLAMFISRHASFFKAYGNLFLISVLLMAYIADYLIRKKLHVKTYKKWTLRTLIFFINILVGSMLFMINFPLKPMVESLAKVQRNIGAHLDDFTFTTFSDDKNHSLAEYQGKVVLINFWATYCGGCIKEFPDIKKLEGTYCEKIKVLVLSDEEPAKIIQVVQKLDAPSGIGFYTNEKWMNLESFRPVTIILDKNGIIREYKWGRNNFEEFKEMINKYLN